jgi:hypothetical protein
MLVRVGLVGFLGVVVWLFQAAQSGYCLQCGSGFSETPDQGCFRKGRLRADTF